MLLNSTYLVLLKQMLNLQISQNCTHIKTGLLALIFKYSQKYIRKSEFIIGPYWNAT